MNQCPCCHKEISIPKVPGSAQDMGNLFACEYCQSVLKREDADLKVVFEFKPEEDLDTNSEKNLRSDISQDQLTIDEQNAGLDQSPLAKEVKPLLDEQKNTPPLEMTPMLAEEVLADEQQDMTDQQAGNGEQKNMIKQYFEDSLSENEDNEVLSVKKSIALSEQELLSPENLEKDAEKQDFDKENFAHSKQDTTDKDIKQAPVDESTHLEKEEQIVGQEVNFSEAELLSEQDLVTKQPTQESNDFLDPQVSVDSDNSSSTAEDKLQDFSDVESYGNSSGSNVKGFLRYDLLIEGLDSSEIKNQVFLILEDPRFNWSAKEIMQSEKQGQLVIKNLNPVKALCLVSELAFVSVKISWKQYKALSAPSQ